MRVLRRMLASAVTICLSHVSTYAQSPELAEVRLLGSPDAPAQSAAFELINKSDETIRLIVVSCHLLNETGKVVAVKAVRFRNVPAGSIIGDAVFPGHVRGTDVACRMLHQRRDEVR